MTTAPPLPTVVDAELELAAGRRARSRARNWQLFRRRFFRHKLAVVSVVILLVLLIVVCFGAPLVRAVPEEPDRTCSSAPGGPSAKHWFGTERARPGHAHAGPVRAARSR